MIYFLISLLALVLLSFLRRFQASFTVTRRGGLSGTPQAVGFYAQWAFINRLQAI